jgi:GT2 family glycosyltransferase
LTAEGLVENDAQQGDSHIAIGVIVVNWRNAPDTLRCLDSLVSATPLPRRVVVVDNGSGDDSVEQTIDWASRRAVTVDLVHDAEGTRLPAAGPSWLTVVSNPTNLGFAGGNNVGLALLRRDRAITHFLLLNNDATVARDYFGEIGRAALSRERVGLCIGTIYEDERRDRVWYAGGRFIPMRALVEHERELPGDAVAVETEFVTGCAMLISRSALERAGALPECYYPGYMEDAEYSWRVRRCGLALLYAPSAVAYHKVGGSFGSGRSPSVAFHLSRHRLFFVRRNLHGVQRLAALFYMGITKPARALLDTLRGNPRLGWATLRGTLSGFFSRAATSRVFDEPR